MNAIETAFARAEAMLTDVERQQLARKRAADAYLAAVSSNVSTAQEVADAFRALVDSMQPHTHAQENEP